MPSKRRSPPLIAVTIGSGTSETILGQRDATTDRAVFPHFLCGQPRLQQKRNWCVAVRCSAFRASILERDHALCGVTIDSNVDRRIGCRRDTARSARATHKIWVYHILLPAIFAKIDRLGASEILQNLYEHPSGVGAPTMLMSLTLTCIKLLSTGERFRYPRISTSISAILFTQNVPPFNSRVCSYGRYQ